MLRAVPRFAVWLLAAALLGGGFAAQAQWLTQSIGLSNGWNAVFLHVDASHTNLNGLVVGEVGNPILEIWRWNPRSLAQFSDSPTLPSAAVEWTSWNRTNASGALQRLVGDSAYLVRIPTNIASYNWRIKGRPVPPRHTWTSSGLNLLGFSTVTNPPPNFRDFLARSTDFPSLNPEIYYYPGGDLKDKKNPLLLPSLLWPTFPVKRGQAFWIRSGTVFNRYFGPFEVLQVDAGGVDFGDSSGSSTFRLRNLTASNLTVTLRLVNSEPSPVGQTPIVAVPPLLLRGELNATNLTYGYTQLPVNTPRTWTLAPHNQSGSEVEVVLGLNRPAIAQAPGSLLAAILRFTDSLGFSQVDVPVSATAGSSAGLWVGAAAIDQVGQYLVQYARGDQTNYVEAANGERSISSIVTNQLVQDAQGRYLANATNTSLAPVPRSYSGRLIIHNPTNGNAVLLQRVYYGFDRDTNVAVASGESALHSGYLNAARRVSSTFLPWTADNTRWPLSGNLGPAQTLSSAPVTLPFSDQAANPFLHTYHPDHDNLNATFDGVQPQGVESYTVERVIRLIVQPPANDFYGIVERGDTLTGGFEETITLQGLVPNSREFRVSGGFTLKRISPVPTLTIAP
jgi:hypothetical protein